MEKLTVENALRILSCIAMMVLLLLGVSVWCLAAVAKLTIVTGIALVLMVCLYTYGTMRVVTALWPQ